MKINKADLQKIILEETEKALSEVLSDIQGAILGAPGGGDPGELPRRGEPATIQAAAAKPAEQQQGQSQAAQKSLVYIQALYNEMKKTSDLKDTTEIIKNTLYFVINNGLRTVSLQQNMDPESKKEINSLLKAGQNMYALIGQTQQKLADLTAARATAAVGGPAAAQQIKNKVLNQPVGKPATQQVPVQKPAGTRPRVTARRPPPRAIPAQAPAAEE